MLPVTFAVVETLLLAIAELTTDFNGEYAIDWWVFLMCFVSGPTAAASLISRGCRFVHVFAAVVLASYGAFLFGMLETFEIALYLPPMTVLVLQSCLMRWTNVPPWRIRPSLRSKRGTVTIRWLLWLTAAMAILILFAKLVDPPSELVTLCWMIGPAVLSCCVAHYAIVHLSRRSFWMIMIAFAGVSWLLYAITSLQYVQFGLIDFVISQPNYPAEFGRKIWLFAPAATYIQVCMIHWFTNHFCR